MNRDSVILRIRYSRAVIDRLCSFTHTVKDRFITFSYLPCCIICTYLYIGTYMYALHRFVSTQHGLVQEFSMQAAVL
jgi:hypothetical protein